MIPPLAPPLLLPELLLNLAHYIHPRQYYTCSIVCKTWNAFYNSLVWESCIVDNSQDTRSLILPDTLRKHAHHVRNLTYRGAVPPEYFSIRYPRLRTLELQVQRWFGVEELIRESPTLTTIELSSYRNVLTNQIWDAIKDSPTITALRIYNIEINQPQVLVFLDACSTLERLEVDFCIMQKNTLAEQVLPESFPRMQEVKIRDFKNYSYVSLPIVASSPQLRSLAWHRIRRQDLLDIGNLYARLICATEFLNLESLDITGVHLQDNEIANVLTHMKKPIKKLGLSKTLIGHLSLKALEPHLHSIRELDIAACWKINSCEVAGLLRSCSSLIRFKATKLMADDLKEDDS
ncbi:hypothetical protein BGX26_011251 [Mortierella sp. AD094]|nr:hypothetical protein BGX26_011251 [Mortierella sp. AD094]